MQFRADSSKVADMHEGRPEKMNDVIVEAKVLVVGLNYTYMCKLRTGEFVLNVWVDAESMLSDIDGSGIFLNCSRRPISINSVFEGLRHRRFEVIQEEICVTTFRR